MAAAKRFIDPSAFFHGFTPELVRRMNAKPVSYDPAIADAWGRYLADQNQADFQFLIDSYLPVVWYQARHVKRLNPGIFSEPLEDYVSDGVLGLMQAIRRIKAFSHPLTFVIVRNTIKRSIWNESTARTWAGRKRTESIRTIQKIRSELTAKHGRLPSREELTARLAEKVKNPQIYFYYLDEGVASMVPRSQMEKSDGRKLMRDKDHSQPAPDEKVMHEETVKLALKGLGKQDRQILRMVLAGKSGVAIAEALGLTKAVVAKRLNGVLWEARCRADLAEHLGVEPAETPVKDNYRRFAAVGNMPPARLVG
jgi:RNA polymerase sigma factor (sigma-70 family)